MAGPKNLALIGAAAAAYFAVVFASLHVLDPGTDPVGRAGSEYVLGPYGVLMTSNFLALAVGLLALALAFARVLDRRAAPSLLLVASLGFVVAAIFRTDRGVVATTATGTIHNFAGIGSFVAILVAALWLSRVMGRDPRFASSARGLLLMSYCVAGSFAVLFLVAGPLAATGVFGLAQRLLIASVLAWLFVAALRMRAVVQRTATTPAAAGGGGV